MEYLQVFDEKKNRLEEKVSRDKKYDLPEDRRFMIVLIFIENSKGEFLLQKTSKSRHSCIATTGGHVTYGDTALDTVVKECKEELGIDIDLNEVRPHFTINYERGFDDFYAIVKDVDTKDLKLQKEEVQDAKWATLDEVKELYDKGEFVQYFFPIIELLWQVRDNYDGATKRTAREKQ